MVNCNEICIFCWSPQASVEHSEVCAYIRVCVGEFDMDTEQPFATSDKL